MSETKSIVQTLYTSLEEAVEELHRRRRKDEALCRTVAEFQRTHPPEFLDGEPRAMFARYVVTPGVEFTRLQAMCRRSGLRPLALKFLDDKFVARNRDKHMLGMLRFRSGNGSRKLRTVNFCRFEGKKLSKVQCLSGQSLPDFHHRLLEHAHPGALGDVVDFSAWFRASTRHDHYYLHWLSLFVTQGILFENFFLDDPEERRFMEERIWPSFTRALELFGVKPLIVRLFTPEEENTPICWQYPGELYPVARDLLNGSSKTEVLSRQHPQLEARDTGRYGQGIFAASDIKAGTFIHTLGGARISLDEFVARVRRGDERLDDALQIGKKTYLDLDEFSRLFNHSCAPSAGLRQANELFALRDIRPGEEITFDYSATVAPTVWRMECRCGSPQCRRVLGDIRSIPKAQLDQYRKAGALQRYMQALLPDILSGSYQIPAYERRALEKLEG